MRGDALSVDLLLIAGLGIGAYFLLRNISVPSAGQIGSDIGSSIVNGALGAASGAFDAAFNAIFVPPNYNAVGFVDPSGVAVSGGGTSGGGTSGGGGGGW